MERIVPIYDAKENVEKSVYRGTFADLLAGIISALVAVIAFGYSVLFFTRFLENDSHLWGIISAFILCFGVGAFGFVPAGLNAIIALKAYKQGTNVKHMIWALLLIVPWFLLSLILVFISDLPKIYAIPVFLTATLLLFWALVSVWRSR